MNWRMKESFLEQLSEDLSDAAKKYKDSLTFWFTELFKMHWTQVGMITIKLQGLK